MEQVLFHLNGVNLVSKQVTKHFLQHIGELIQLTLKRCDLITTKEHEQNDVTLGWVGELKLSKEVKQHDCNCGY